MSQSFTVEAELEMSEDQMDIYEQEDEMIRTAPPTPEEVAKAARIKAAKNSKFGMLIITQYAKKNGKDVYTSKFDNDGEGFASREDADNAIMEYIKERAEAGADLTELLKMRYVYTRVKEEIVPTIKISYGVGLKKADK